MSEYEYATEDHDGDLPPIKPARPNPMHSRCGLHDCDCGYTIEKLVLALEHTRDIVHRTHCPAPASLPQQCWKECEEAMDAMLEAGWMPEETSRR